MVEAILGSRKGVTETQFQIKWKGYGNDEATWEPGSNLNCPKLLEKFRIEESRLAEERNAAQPPSNAIEAPAKDPGIHDGETVSAPAAASAAAAQEAEEDRAEQVRKSFAAKAIRAVAASAAKARALARAATEPEKPDKQQHSEPEQDEPAANKDGGCDSGDGEEDEDGQGLEAAPSSSMLLAERATISALQGLTRAERLASLRRLTSMAMRAEGALAAE